MSFQVVYDKYKGLDFGQLLTEESGKDITTFLTKRNKDWKDFLYFLSSDASFSLEEMAIEAHKATLHNFGKTMHLYTPMYLSNFCENQCLYCGFNEESSAKRKALTLEEVEVEAKFISKTGIQHLLVLTGESKSKSSVEYIIESVKILKKYFSSISLEIYALTADEYSQMVEAGVDGLTIYQEVYDGEMYDSVHLPGPKKNWEFRIDAPRKAFSGRDANS